MSTTSLRSLADLNSDRIADSEDLGILLHAFESDFPAADITNDRRVDTADLGMSIRSFGLACE